MRGYFRQVAGQLLLGSLAGIVMNTMVVMPAILLGRAIDAVLAMERGEASASQVGWAALAFAGGVLLHEGPRIGKRWWLMTANARIRANVRADALRGVLSWPMSRLHNIPIGDLMARIIGDIEVLGVGVREFTIETWDTVLFSCSLVVAMLAYDAGLTVLALLPVPAAMILAKVAGRWVRERTTEARESNAALTATLQERLSGIRVLRLFGCTQATVERLAALSQEQASANLATVRLREGLKPVYTTLMTAGVVLVVWLSGRKVIAGSMTIGAFVAYLELYLRFVGRGFRVPQLVNSIQSGGAAYARLQPLLEKPLSVQGEPSYASFRAGRIAGLGRPLPRPPAVRTGAAELALQEITFHYPGAARPALQGVSLDIPAGALVAVTGPVGSGKSALAKALLGLYPLKSGRILLDGQPLEEIPAEQRTVRIGYLLQDAYLFSGTVEENILLGLPAADGDESCPVLARAIGCASLSDDLRMFPAGLQTQIGELGIRVSGGQRQRIALARAMASQHPQAPGLLVLDDPFSAVDVDTEARIIIALRHAFGPMSPPEQRATIILCSHRLAAFPQADRVVVLDGGRVIEQGTHADLIQAGGLYARIYRAQYEEERHAALAEERL